MTIDQIAALYSGAVSLKVFLFATFPFDMLKDLFYQSLNVSISVLIPFSKINHDIRMFICINFWEI